MFLSHNLILQCQKILPVYKRSVNGRPIIRLCTIVQSSFALFSKFCFHVAHFSCCTLSMFCFFHDAFSLCFILFIIRFFCVVLISCCTLFMFFFPCCTIFILLFLCAIFSCFVFLVLHCHLRFF